MIAYESDKKSFIHDVDHSDIEQIIQSKYLSATGGNVGASELRSWRESLGAMAKVLRDGEIPDDLAVAVEFVLPQAGKRIDMTLTGFDAAGAKGAVIVELKQWSGVEPSPRDAIVYVRYGKHRESAVHPSYQAWSYAAYLQGFNEAVYEQGIALHPCAYLHNQEDDGVLDSDHYAPYVKKAPVFLRGEPGREKLRAFIKAHVRHGGGKSVLYELENGRIRPSKALADVVGKLLNKNPEFILLDEQKEVYEAALAACRTASSESPRVLIVEGGPGTGKSVVAVNLLAVLKDGLNVKYVSKNAAPRAVYAEHLAQSPENAHLQNLFTGSGSFINTPANTFDALIVDEAHRMTEKSGLLGNKGEHQVKEVIRAAKCTVFFIDEDQRISLSDVGTKDLIRQLASAKGAAIDEYRLPSQFRYLVWLDNTLQRRTTANRTLADVPFDFKVFDDPEALHQAIVEKNTRNKARVVGGYCWRWNSRKDASAMDVVIGDYKRQWNLDQDGSLWIVAPDSVTQVGCIHTCQGLEVDYVGVIIGPDMVLEGDRVVTRPRKRDRYDKTMRGYVKLSKADSDQASRLADTIIKNTYRTLMTRGMKGCYVYATDESLRSHLRHCANP
jgi:uncharacterized protein